MIEGPSGAVVQKERAWNTQRRAGASPWGCHCIFGADALKRRSESCASCHALTFLGSRAGHRRSSSISLVPRHGQMGPANAESGRKAPPCVSGQQGRKGRLVGHGEKAALSAIVVGIDKPICRALRAIELFSSNLAGAEASELVRCERL